MNVEFYAIFDRAIDMIRERKKKVRFSVLLLVAWKYFRDYLVMLENVGVTNQ